MANSGDEEEIGRCVWRCLQLIWWLKVWKAAIPFDRQRWFRHNFYELSNLQLTSVKELFSNSFRTVFLNNRDSKSPLNRVVQRFPFRLVNFVICLLEPGYCGNHYNNFNNYYNNNFNHDCNISSRRPAPSDECHRDGCHRSVLNRSGFKNSTKNNTPFSTWKWLILKVAFSIAGASLRMPARLMLSSVLLIREKVTMHLPPHAFGDRLKLVGLLNPKTLRLRFPSAGNRLEKSPELYLFSDFLSICWIDGF